MAEAAFTSDYSLFDSKAYCDTYYSRHAGESGLNELCAFSVDSLLEVYNSGDIKGTTLLDFGTGPTIYNLITASRHFQEIYLSDYSLNNRNALWRWLSKDPTSYDFSPFFEYLRKKEPSKYFSSVEDEMRGKVKGILSCDMNQENPLFPSIFPQFDVISSSGCLEISPSVAAYEAGAKNIASLLKPAGSLVLIGDLRGTFYHVGQYIFPVLPLTSEEVKRIWSNIGFSINSWKQYDFPDGEQHEGVLVSDCAETFCMTATKYA